MQQEDGRHASYGKHASSDSFQDKNGDVSLQMKLVASTSSSSHEEKRMNIQSSTRGINLLMINLIVFLQSMIILHA